MSERRYLVATVAFRNSADAADRASVSRSLDDIDARLTALEIGPTTRVSSVEESDAHLDAISTKPHKTCVNGQENDSFPGTTDFPTQENGPIQESPDTSFAEPTSDGGLLHTDVHTKDDDSRGCELVEAVAWGVARHARHDPEQLLPEDIEEAQEHILTVADWLEAQQEERLRVHPRAPAGGCDYTVVESAVIRRLRAEAEK